ncbi:PorP/SprF family type IX secretion system membrane protein [Sediminibacterium soli]|uniref:PorP/SprF family type IX secretion system membrane protein n=1 Tax=Sediminibacterium soli TaxID=2698829 RepID=UPI00137A8B2A|nr:PorP/SprF family type IX secretion system membrane protein [Sediminibacterium soli]NCI47605.1 type IX secretion system membrane protein PorP/SprF [Sediminibacterium soli]
MKTKFYTLLLTLCCSGSLMAQDFSFSQFYEQPLLRNPALAGLFVGDLRVSMAYRDQWSSVTVPYRTASLSVEHKTPIGKHDDFITIGAQMSLDGAGDIRLKRTQFLPAVNFHKSLNPERDTYLSLAVMGGPVSSQFDPTKLKMGDQYGANGYDPGIPSAQPISRNGYSYWDLSTGLCFSTVLDNNIKFYLAAGVSHITRPTIRSVINNGSTFLSPKISFSMGTSTKMGDRGHVIAFADYYAQNGNRQLLGGLLYGIDLTQDDSGDDQAAIYAGSFLRWDDAVIPVVKIDFGHMTMGVSYDINISKLTVASNWRGGLEFTAAYRGFLKIRSSTLDRVRCVRF